MRKWYRLTALVLAFAIVLSTVSGALAQVEVDYSEYLRWVEDVKAANGLAGVISIDEGGEVLVEPSTFTGATNAGPQYTTETTQNLGTYAADSAPTVDVALEQYGKVTLDAPAAGQWQAYLAAADLWVNISGETGSTFELTFAKVQSLFAANGHAQLRCLMGDKVTETVNVGMSYSLNALPATSKAAVKALNAVTKADGVKPAAEGTFNVVINYVYENNDVVAEPYAANLAQGSDFSAIVTFPVIQGYLPYFGNATESTDSYELNITNIQADITYTVTYKPTNVDYTVIHYQQNVDNDNYTEVARETKQGLTKSIVPEVAKNYDGFYALLYEKPEIAADGSTVVEIYYDRYYYLMNFALGGGYGTEPIYARYGAPLGEIKDPVLAGYTFQGWSLDGTTKVSSMPTTMPAGNVTYTALWKADATAKVSVVFWGENPNDEGYSYLQTGVVKVAPGTSYTYANGNTVFLICGKTEHTHTENCVLKCGKEEHTTHTEACLECSHGNHTLACYKLNVTSTQSRYRELRQTSKPTQIDTPSQDGIYSYTTGSGNNRETHYYLYLQGVWYCGYSTYYNNYVDTSEIVSSCTHMHTTDCYSCEYHEHSLDCYSCGLEEHTHSSSCNQTGSGLDSNLWTFIRSETVTVKADGSSVINVYYDRKSFTMTFKNQGYNGSTLGTITDKWGANIMQRFKTISQANTFFWSKSSNGGSPWTSFMDVMPPENRTYYADPQSGSTTLTAKYYGQALNGTGYDELYTVSFRGSSTISVTKEEFVVIEGFTFNASRSSEVGDRYNGSAFYYDRNHYAIEFYSPTVLLKKQENIYYQSPLTSYNWTPDASMAPAQYEPGSVVFAGWYLNPECTGTAFDFATKTMPAVPSESGDASISNSGATALTLYAKWVPVNLTVEFYLDKTAYDAGTKLSTHPDVTVQHGNFVVPTPATPDNGDYTFVGWFYEENGEEKAYDFVNMPVKKNLKVYGKWSSNVLKEYTVYFKLNGTDTEIADPITGSALAGNTKTFEAKGGEELYVGYQDGYFPLTKSHSITLNIEDETQNTFTFYYVQKDAVPYTVYYVAETLKDGGTSLGTIERDGKTYYIIADTYTNSQNRKAVVTEKFKTVSGYMPDAYQKRLVVDGTDGAVNEIIFYYSVDTTHAYYKITHYTQNLDGETWTEYASSEAVGNIGDTYTASPLTISGFTFDPNVEMTVRSGVLTANGLALELYYVRNAYPYKVRYLEQGTGKVLAPEKTLDNNGELLKGLHGAVVSESAIPIDGFTAKDPTTASLNIRIEEDTSVAKLNVFTFYYVENEVTITYVPVGPEGATNFGSVAPTSETLKVLTETAQGSTAAAKDNYTFVGWYADPTCEGTAISTDATYVPGKVDGKNVAATYYAKFVENDVTINYVAVGPQGATNFGSVDPADETIKVLTGIANGSTATAGPDYTFDGWYSDATLETKVSGETHYTPAKVEGKNVAATYYAKFVENEVTINYEAVGPQGATDFGSVDPTSETLKVLTETAQGSTAAAKDNYTFVGWYADPTCEGTAISTDATYVPGKVDGKNVAATYYAKFVENDVTINYVPRFRDANGTVGAATDAIGTVTPTSEELTVLTGVAQGSTAAATVNTYRFVGWYSDDACTVEVGAEAKYVPTKEANTAWVNGTTYYALFEYNLTTLTIEKEGMADIDNGQSFLFKVTGEGLPAEGLLIAINGNGSETISGLTVGQTYTVTEVETWSWRYTAQSKSITLAATGNKIIIDNTRDKIYWLDGDCYAENVFGGN